MSQKSKPMTASSLYKTLIIVTPVISLILSPEEPWMALIYPVVLVLLPYLLGPILFHRIHQVRLDLRYEPIDPLGTDLPEVVARDAGDIESQMEVLGFTIDGYYGLASSGPGMGEFVSLFHDQATGDISTSLSMVLMSENPSLVTSSLAFVTNFSDGTLVQTSNNTSPPVCPKMPPLFYRYSFPEIRQAASLYSIHKAIVSRLEGGRIRVNPVADNPLRALKERELDRQYAHLIENGYYCRDDKTMLMRPTWKGATLVVWKLCWPVKQIHLALWRASARRLLRQLELGTWVP